MNRFLKNPIFNAICIGLFTAFYAAVFLASSKNAQWKGFFAYAMIAVTILIIVLLISRKKAFDEYHLSVLLHCLTVSLILTIMAIAIFYLLVLFQPAGIPDKFTFFVVLHWATVVAADLVYVLLCRWK